MAVNLPAQTGNHLLDSLDLQDLLALSRDFEWCDHYVGDRISEPGQPMDYAYFPVSGIYSVVAHFNRVRQLEAGIIGKEGFLGLPMILAAGHSPHLLLVRSAGQSLRIPADRLLEACNSRQQVREQLLRFAHVYMMQLTSTVFANCSYTIIERLARWILMCQDRHDAIGFAVTHEFMALLLAVRRPGITEALHILEGKHLIRSTRGMIHILNRAGLEEVAGESYGSSEREHARLIVPAAKSVPATVQTQWAHALTLGN